MWDEIVPQHLTIMYNRGINFLYGRIGMELVGKFHSHITVQCDTDDIERLKKLCSQLYCKCTVIDLERDDIIQRDIMLTHHFHTKHGRFKSVETIREYLQECANTLNENGFPTIRIKLEHESLPTLDPTVDHYREVHFKCIMPSCDRDRVLTSVTKSNKLIVPSSNPFEVRKDGSIVQFFNVRFYSGTVADIDAMSDDISELIGQFCTVKEIKRESVVFDTNLQHDKWWA